MGYQTHNPNDPVVGLDIQASVGVTILWTNDGTALDPSGIDTADPSKNGVVYDPPQWDPPGKGPFDIYEQQITQPKLVGSVEWSVLTKTFCTREIDPSGTNYRLVVTPEVNLIRTETRIGQGAVDYIAYSSPASPQYGNWVPIHSASSKELTA